MLILLSLRQEDQKNLPFVELLLTKLLNKSDKSIKTK